MRCARVATLLAAMLLAPHSGRAEDLTQTSSGGGASPPAAAPDAPGFKSDEIGSRAEDVAAQLRAMTAAIADQGAFRALESEVLRYSHRVADRWKETDQILAGSPRRAPRTQPATAYVP